MNITTYNKYICYAIKRMQLFEDMQLPCHFRDWLSSHCVYSSNAQLLKLIIAIYINYITTHCYAQSLLQSLQ